MLPPWMPGLAVAQASPTAEAEGCESRSGSARGQPTRHGPSESRCHAQLKRGRCGFLLARRSVLCSPLAARGCKPLAWQSARAGQGEPGVLLRTLVFLCL